MNGGAFTLYRIHHFPAKAAQYRTQPRRPRGARDYQAAPTFTTLDLRGRRLVHGFLEARLEHRDGVRIEGMWHDEPVHELVKVEVFPAYYRAEKKLFVACANRVLSKAATDRLNKDLPDDVHLVAIRLDFAKLLESLPTGTPILGAWSTDGKRASVRTRAVFGDRIDKAAEFKRMRASGQLSNLSLVFPLGQEHMKVNLSRAGSAFFLDDRSLGDRLRLMEHLAGFESRPESSTGGGSLAAAETPA